ncbi:MAG: hypothetical protein Q9167_005436 [Letrouitia subvulpina]
MAGSGVDCFDEFTNIPEIYGEKAPSEAQQADVSTAINSAPQDNSAAISSNSDQPFLAAPWYPQLTNDNVDFDDFFRFSSEDTVRPTTWSPSQQPLQLTPPTPWVDPWFNGPSMPYQPMPQHPHLQYQLPQDTPTEIPAFENATTQEMTDFTFAPPLPPTSGVASGPIYVPPPTSAPIFVQPPPSALIFVPPPPPPPPSAPNSAPQKRQPRQQQPRQQKQKQPKQSQSQSQSQSSSCAAPKSKRQRRENRHATIDTHQGAGGKPIAFALQTTDTMHKTLAEDGNQTSKYNGFQPVPRFGKDGRCTRGMKRKRGVVGAIGADDDDKDDDDDDNNSSNNNKNDKGKGKAKE